VVQSSKEDMNLIPWGNLQVHTKKRSFRKALVRGVDFGGHCLFYTTHQVFLTRRGINIIVIDITRKLDDMVEDDDFRHLGVRQKAKVKGQ